MATKNATPVDPFANLTPADLKIVGRIAEATRKAEKASESLNRVLAEANKAGLHTRAGFSNFGKWAEAAMAAKGVKFSKSRAYNAVKIAEVRDASPHSAALSDTVCLRIAEAGPMGDAERLEAFVTEVAATGGTVESVRKIANPDGETRDPSDALAEDFAKRIVRLCKGDAKGAEAILSYTASEVKRLMIEATKSALK